MNVEYKNAITMDFTRFCKSLPVILLCASLLCACGGDDGEKEAETAGTEKPAVPTKEQVLGEIKTSGDLVTTELKIRKIALYDTSKSEKFSITDIRTWKYGDRKCIVPLEISIKYGYDINDITADDIIIDDDSSAIVVKLPKPKIIDSSYNTYIDEKSVVSMSTGMRSPIGHAEIEEIRKKAYDSVMKQDLTGVVGDEVEKNATSLLESMLRGMGFTNITMVTRSRSGF